jgi:hypothetical protein
VDNCKPLPMTTQVYASSPVVMAIISPTRPFVLIVAVTQGLTFVHVRAQLEQLQDTFMGSVGLHGGQESST